MWLQLVWISERYGTSHCQRARSCDIGSRWRSESAEELGHHMGECWSGDCHQPSQQWKSEPACFLPHQDMECSHKEKTNSPWWWPADSPQHRSSQTSRLRSLGCCRAWEASPVDTSS